MSCATGASICCFIDVRALVAVLVRIPVAERDVLGGDFDVARARLDQAPRQQAALPEAAGVVNVEALARLEREVERLGRGRGQQPVGRVQRADQRLALEIAAVLIDGLARQQLLVQLAAASETRVAEFGRADARRTPRPAGP